jgi:hypothetical protein
MLVIGLALALRLLSPAGFMPAFAHGAVTILACPDAAPAPINHHHHSSDHKSAHQQCPYAAASGLAAAGVEWPATALVLAFAAALLLGRTYAFLERQRDGERPPAIGPPIPA